jgi:hypothetical protein
MNNTKKASELLAEILGTLECGGSFAEWDCCDDDSGLPFVYSKLLRLTELLSIGGGSINARERIDDAFTSESMGSSLLH